MATPNTNAMIKKLGKPEVPFMVRDSDGDGTMNVLDGHPKTPFVGLSKRRR